MTDHTTDMRTTSVVARASARGASWTRDERSAKLLRYAAWFYGIAWAVHTGDHLRRGFSAITTEVNVLGTTAAILQVAAIVLVFRRHWLAPIFAVAIGFPDGIGIAAVHLLPHWSSFSDAFPGAHGTGVTGFSWVAAVVEIVAALTFGAAGVYSLRRGGWPDSSPEPIPAASSMPPVTQSRNESSRQAAAE